MTTSLIAADDILTLGSLVFGLVAFAFWIETTKVGKATSGVLWVIVGALILSNTSVIPYSSPLYNTIFQYAVPLSIPLLLMKANLRTLFRECGAVLKIFFFAALGTSLGCVLAFYLLDLGPIGPKVAGVYAGGWIGGAVNLVAVSQAVEMTETELATALSASSPVSIGALMILITLPSIALIRKLLPSRIIDQAGDLSEHGEQDEEVQQMRLTHISAALALSFVICAISAKTSSALGFEQYNLLLVTVLTIVVANVMPTKLGELQGEFNLGIFFMYLFFAAIGAGTNMTEFLQSAPILFFYGVLIILIHLAFVLICAKIFKFDLAETIIASAAALVGPAPSAAIAISRGWRELITPAIMCGIFGYAIANFVGVGITKILGG